MARELDELSERYSTLLAEHKSSPDAPHITWVGAREVLRRAVGEAYELGLEAGVKKTIDRLAEVNEAFKFREQPIEKDPRQNQIDER